MKHSTFIQHQAKYILCTLAMLVTFVGTAWGDTTTTWNFSDAGWTAGTTKDGLTPGSGVSFDENTKSIDGFSFTKRLKLVGTMDDAKNVSFAVTGPCTIKVYGISSSKDNTRYLKINSESYNGTAVVESFAENDGNTIGGYSYIYTGSAATLYLGSTNSGYNIYAIQVTYSSPATHSVTYALNGGEGTAPTQASVAEGGTFTVAGIGSVTKSDYTFSGWNDGTSDYAAGATYTMGTSDVTLTAQWTATPIYTVTHTIYFDADNGIGATMPDPVSLKEGDTYEFPNLDPKPTKFGQTFYGWNDGNVWKAVGYQYTMGSKDVTLKASYYVNHTNSVNFNSNDAIIGTLKEPISGQSILLPAGYSSYEDITSSTSWTGTQGTETSTSYSGISGYQALYYNKPTTGDVMHQELTGLANGTYEVIMSVAASYTQGNGITGGQAGNNLTYAFAGEKEISIPVLDRTWVNSGDQNIVALIAEVTDGTLNFGLRSKTASGNWYVIKVESLRRITDTGGFTGWYNESGTRVGGAGGSYSIQNDGETLYAHWGIGRTIEYNSSSKYVYSNGGNAHITVSADDGTEYTANGAAEYYKSTSSTSINDKCYLNRNKIDGNRYYVTTFDSKVYAGAKIEIEEGYKFTPTNINVKVAVGENFCYRVVINDGTKDVYTSNDITVTNFTKEDATNLDFSDALSGFSLKEGTSYIRLYYWLPNLEANKYIVPLELSLTGAVEEVTKIPLTTFAWSKSSDEIAYGAAYTSPTFTATDASTTYSKENNNLSTAVKFSTDNEEVATVSEDGTVTLKGISGTANITATVTSDFTTESSPATYTIKVNPALHLVTYNINGASSDTPIQDPVAEGSTFTAATTPNRYGYAFDGWNTEVDGSGTYYGAGEVITMGNSDITLTAQWTKQTKHSVTYVLDGGTSELPTQKSLFEDQTFILADTPYKFGFTFTGWSDGTNPYVAGDTYIMGAVDVTLTAQWELTSTKTINFNANGGNTYTPLKEPYNGQQIFLPSAYTTGGDIERPTTWTVANNVTNNGNYTGISGKTCHEAYYQFSVGEGDVITQSLGNLAPGTYEVIMTVGASYAANRGVATDCQTGNGLTYAFAGDQEINIPVIYRTWISKGQENIVSFTVDVTDGNLKYGIKNKAKSGNWYIINIESLKKIDNSTFLGWYTAATGGSRIGGAGDAYTIKTDGETLYAQWASMTQKTVNFDVTNGGITKKTSITEPPLAQGVMLPSAYSLITDYTGYATALGVDDWTRAAGHINAGTCAWGYETYQLNSIPDGDVITQTVSVPNGTYEVVLSVAASYAANNGVSVCPTGNNMAFAFANNESFNIPVIERKDLNNIGADIVVLTTEVTNGQLTYGIKNKKAGGNWYVVKVESIRLINKGAFLGWYDAKSGGNKIGDEGDIYAIKVDNETLYAHWSYSSDNAVVAGPGTTNYKLSGYKTYRCEAKGDIKDAAVTSDGLVSWSSESEGGAIVVYATDYDDITTHFVITVPYTTHNWVFGISNSHPEFTDYYTEDLKGKNYNLAIIYKTDKKANNELNDPVVAISDIIKGDNAYYLSATAGLIFTCTEANCLGPNAVIDYGSATSYDDKKTASTLDNVTSSKYIAMRRSTLTIPNLKKGQHIRMQWCRRNDHKGDDMTATNLTDLEGKSIDEIFYVGRIPRRTEPECRSFEEFIVKEDGDVSFTNYDKEWMESIDQITVGDATHFNMTMGTDDQFIRTTYRVCTTATHTLPYINIPSGNSTTVNLTTAYGTVYATSAITTKYYVKDPTRGITPTMTEDGTLDITAYRNGYITIVQKGYDNGYVLDYNEERKHVTISGTAWIEQTFTKQYPFSWDFTNISDDTFSKLSAASKVDDNDIPLEEWTTWGYDSEEGYYGIRLIDDFIQGAALSISKETEYERLEEFQGLGIKANYDNQVRIHSDNKGLEFTVPQDIGKDAHMIIPTVPTGYKVFVRGQWVVNEENRNISATDASNSTPMTVTQMFENHFGNKYNDEESEQIYIIEGQNSHDIDIDVKGFLISKIGVSKTSKSFNTYNDASYTTDCQDYNVKYDLSSYFTNGMFPVTGKIIKSTSENSVNFSDIEVAPKNTGTVLISASSSGTNKAGITLANVPLFVRDVNSQEDNTSGNLLVGVTEDTEIKPQDGKIAYILTNKYYDCDKDFNAIGSKKTGELGFYRLLTDKTQTLKANKAYLLLGSGTSNATKKAYYLWELFDDDYSPTNINDTENYQEDHFVNNGDDIYTLQGIKVRNPTKGIYIVNGKKIVIK